MPAVVVNLAMIAKTSEPLQTVFAPGDDLAVVIDNDDIETQWCDNVDGEDPGITVAQAEILRDLIEMGVSIAIEEDGSIKVIEV